MLTTLSMLPLGAGGCECRDVPWYSALSGAAEEGVPHLPLTRAERRARYVHLEAAAMATLSGEDPLRCPTTLELFDGERHTVESLRRSEGPQGSRIVQGRLREVADGDVTAALVGGALSATVQANGKRYRIHQVEGAVHRVVELNPGGYPED